VWLGCHVPLHGALDGVVGVPCAPAWGAGWCAMCTCSTHGYVSVIVCLQHLALRQGACSVAASAGDWKQRAGSWMQTDTPPASAWMWRAKARSSCTQPSLLRLRTYSVHSTVSGIACGLKS